MNTWDPTGKSLAEIVDYLAWQMVIREFEYPYQYTLHVPSALMPMMPRGIKTGSVYVTQDDLTRSVSG